MGAGLIIGAAGLLGLKSVKPLHRGSTEPNYSKLLLWGSLVSLGGFTFLAGAFKR